MILAVIVIVLVWMGVLFNVLNMLVQGTELDFLPWNFLGIIFFICGYVAIAIRARASHAWSVIELPTPGQKLSITAKGANIVFEKLYPSIAGLLKTKNDEYYRENTDGAYNFAGHDCRLTDGESGYVIDTLKARFINGLERDGFYDYEHIINTFKKEMIKAKNEDGTFILTNTFEPLAIEDINLKTNPIHKEFFEGLMEKYVKKIHGIGYNLKSYKRFQDKQSAPYNIGSVIHYVKSISAMKATGIRKGMGGAGKWIFVIALVVIMLIALLMLGTGMIKIPGLNV